jgi:hypothetical protein
MLAGILGALIAATNHAHAQTEIERAMDMGQHDHIEGHAEFHDHYVGWCQPGYPKPCLYVNSCCKEKHDGSGDCFPTDGEVRNGKWFLRDQHGVMIEMPEDKEVHEINPDETTTRGHLCQNPYTDQIFCWRPPTGGT